MPVPHISGAFGDLLDPRFQKIFNDQLDQLPDMIPTLYDMVGTNGRNEMKWSDIGTLPDWTEFTGTVGYQSQAQGFDMTLTPVEFASGVQVERKLFDDDQFNVMDSRPKGLATSLSRTRQSHGAGVFSGAFSVDETFFINTEGVALCSASHTTNSGASTATGFDNLTTVALTAVELIVVRNLMVGFRGDQGERISVMPDEILIPNALYDVAYEIVQSAGTPADNDNSRNVHEGQYRIIEWNYLPSAVDWFLMDSTMRNQYLFWSDRVSPRVRPHRGF